MKRILRHRPTPATVIACIALAVALGGTGYAATALPKNSVGAKQLKKNAVINSKIKNGAVTGAKVKADSLTGANILESSLGKVASASSADSATNATHATNATTAANANLLGGLAANQFLGISGKAANSDKLDGLNSTDFLGATAKAADSDKLDGIDSSGFVRGAGTRHTFNLVCGGCAFNGFGQSPGAGEIILGCPTAGHAYLQIQAREPFVSYDLWVDVDGSLTRSTLAAYDYTDTPTVVGLHHVSLRTQEAGGTIGAYDIFLDGTNCQAMGVVDIAYPG